MEGSGQLHALATLPTGKEPLVHIESEAGWVPEAVWTLLERRKIVFPLTGIYFMMCFRLLKSSAFSPDFKCISHGSFKYRIH
jgi:hypothetical protein